MCKICLVSCTKRLLQSRPRARLGTSPGLGPVKVSPWPLMSPGSAARPPGGQERITPASVPHRAGQQTWHQGWQKGISVPTQGGRPAWSPLHPAAPPGVAPSPGMKGRVCAEPREQQHLGEPRHPGQTAPAPRLFRPGNHLLIE